MPNLVHAILIDTTSIQKYIFSSNKLRENLGASYIIEHLAYGQCLEEAIKQTLDNGIDVDLDEWKPVSNSSTIEIQKTSNSNTLICDNKLFEIGYIGGGNALIFFLDDPKTLTNDTVGVISPTVKFFIKNYTKLLLVRFPNLTTAFGIKSITFSEYKSYFKEGTQFTNFKKELFKTLAKNKSQFHPTTSTSKHGITVDCPLSNLAAENDIKIGDHIRWISSASKTKLEHGEIAHDTLNDRYSFLKNKYSFAQELDRLGQQDEKSYIAVVHIDGNNMGRRFETCDSIPKQRTLSNSISNAVKDTLNVFGEYVTSLMEDASLVKNIGLQKWVITGIREDEFRFLNYELYNDNIEEGGLKIVLPFRPIIVGGDDITFACDGRLGVHLAEKFVELLNKQQVEGGLSSCAGVAIVKTKYPFYKAVKLAEDLCQEAKKEARKYDGSSFLSFIISANGITSSLEHFRDNSIDSSDEHTYKGPYRVDKTGESTSTMHQLKIKLRDLHIGEIWTKNKVMQWREALFKGKSYRNKLRLQLELQQKKSEEISIPSYDEIDLMDFYPKQLLS